MKNGGGGDSAGGRGWGEETGLAVVMLEGTEVSVEAVEWWGFGRIWRFSLSQHLELERVVFDWSNQIHCMAENSFQSYK